MTRMKRPSRLTAFDLAPCRCSGCPAGRGCGVSVEGARRRRGVARHDHTVSPAVLDILGKDRSHDVADRQTQGQETEAGCARRRHRPGRTGEGAGLSREYVDKLEAGRQDPSLSTSSALAKALGVPATARLE